MKLLSRLTATLAIIFFMATTASAQGTTPDSLLIIKNRGIAGIRLGMKMSKVPQSIPGLYNGYEEDYGCEVGLYYQCKVTVPGEFNSLEFCDDDENDLIDFIYVGVLGAQIDGTDIVIGKPISDLINTPGLKKIVDKYDPDSYEYVYKGIYHLGTGFLEDPNIEVLCSISWGFRY